MTRSADTASSPFIAAHADSLPAGGSPGEILPAAGTIALNAGRQTRRLMVVNTGDRPVQVGSHYHFAEVNPALSFDRERAWGWRLDIPSGGATRFEPGQEREVSLVPYGGAGKITGFHGGDAQRGKVWQNDVTKGSEGA